MCMLRQICRIQIYIEPPSPYVSSFCTRGMRHIWPYGFILPTQIWVPFSPDLPAKHRGSSRGSRSFVLRVAHEMGAPQHTSVRRRAPIAPVLSTCSALGSDFCVPSVHDRAIFFGLTRAPEAKGQPWHVWTADNCGQRYAFRDGVRCR